MSSVQKNSKKKKRAFDDTREKHPSKIPRSGKLDSFDLGVIRRIIHQFYLRNEIPTLEKIFKELRQNMDFPYKKPILAESLVLVHWIVACKQSTPISTYRLVEKACYKGLPIAGHDTDISIKTCPTVGRCR